MDQGGGLAGRVMVVTGAAQGVGEATARLMAARGAKGLALIDRNGSRAADVAASLSASGCRAVAIATELEDVSACRAAIQEAGEQLGQLHGLVNAAGATDRGSIDTASPEIFDRLMAVNARAPFFLIQAILPWLRRAGGGTIVSVTSLTIHCGPAYLTAYVGSKAALAAMTRNIAAQVAQDRIRVNALNLGWTVTPNEQIVQTRVHGLPEGWATREGASQPFGRLLDAEDAARALFFLASDESSLMTGTVVDFDQRVVGSFPLRVPQP